MPRRRSSVPSITPARGRGIAGSAYERHVTGGGFGTPGTGRRIRQFPVDQQPTLPPLQGGQWPGDRPRRISQQPYPTQQEIVARYRQQDAMDRKRGTGEGIRAAIEGDDALLMPIDMQAKSSYPSRPRAVAAGYDSKAGTVRIRFRPPHWPQTEPNGVVYEYYGVPRNVWLNMLRAASPGRYIGRVLDTYPYARLNGQLQVDPRGFYTTREDFQ